MRRYQEILRIPHVKILLFSAFPARVAYGMLSLSIFFKTFHETDSIPLAGLAIGLNSLSTAVTAGLRGSVMDHWGQRWPLRIFVPTYASMLLLLNRADTSFSILVLSFILGLVAPPINLSIRPLWKSVVPPDFLRTAYALDTSVLSASGVIGPVIATTLALSTYPASPLIACAVLILIGGGSLAMTKVSRNWVPEIKVKGSPLLWRHRAMQLLMFEGCFIGFGWGAFNVGVPAFATLENLPHRTAWILGIMGVCNIVGGLLGGLVSKGASSLTALRRTYAIWFAVSLPLVLTYPGWSMALVGAALGLCGGALHVFYWETLEAVRPQGSATASLGWIWSVEGSFMALGAAFGGWVSQAISPRVALGITTIAIGCGLLILTLGRERLSAANRIPTADEDLQAMKDNVSPVQ